MWIFAVVVGGMIAAVTIGVVVVIAMFVEVVVSVVVVVIVDGVVVVSTVVMGVNIAKLWMEDTTKVAINTVK